MAPSSSWRRPSRHSSSSRCGAPRPCRRPRPRPRRPSRSGGRACWRRLGRGCARWARQSATCSASAPPRRWRRSSVASSASPACRRRLRSSPAARRARCSWRSWTACSRGSSTCSSTPRGGRVEIPHPRRRRLAVESRMCGGAVALAVFGRPHASEVTRGGAHIAGMLRGSEWSGRIMHHAIARMRVIIGTCVSGRGGAAAGARTSYTPTDSVDSRERR
mmetsp:Transcript_70716/g.194000  ORF Transcript_70716/g.194000 Transcript_70716/m.194000 type:complete len:219 (-) Transcript_70716:104-760(-)